MSLDPIVACIHDHLASLPEDRRRTLAQATTLRARSLGLTVLRGQRDLDIPLTLTPEIVDGATLSKRGRDARAVLAQETRTDQARHLFAHFGPLEQRCLENWERAKHVTIARVDWFIDAAGCHHALELNAIIPAMTAYFDAAASAWIETMGAHVGLDHATISRLLHQNGSNTEELLASIVARSGRHPKECSSLAILHRRMAV